MSTEAFGAVHAQSIVVVIAAFPPDLIPFPSLAERAAPQPKSLAFSRHTLPATHQKDIGLTDVGCGMLGFRDMRKYVVKALWPESLQASGFVVTLAAN